MPRPPSIGTEIVKYSSAFREKKQTKSIKSYVLGVVRHLGKLEERVGHVVESQDQCADACEVYAVLVNERKDDR